MSAVRSRPPLPNFPLIFKTYTKRQRRVKDVRECEMGRDRKNLPNAIRMDLHLRSAWGKNSHSLFPCPLVRHLDSWRAALEEPIGSAAAWQQWKKELARPRWSPASTGSTGQQ